MNAMLYSSYSPLTTNSEATLERLGFTPTSGGYQRGDIYFTLGTHWCVLQAPQREQPRLPAASPGDPFENARASFASRTLRTGTVRAPGAVDVLAALGQPALWKQVSAGDDVSRVFELPWPVWDAALSAEADGEANALEECLHWALTTADSLSLPDWQPPTRALVESWFKPEDLTVVAGALLRQGEFILESDRFALRFPLVPEIPDDLPASRLAWLRALLEEAQNRWHLVRLGFARDHDGVLSAVAEVDLTGVPHEIAEDLFVFSLEALRWVVQWLGETTDWLADAAVASELLAVCLTTKP